MAQPSIGQRATLGGKPVVWSGQNYGWQSPATHKKLEQQGKLKIGTQAIDRVVSSVSNSPLVQAARQFQQQFRQATDRLGFDKVEGVVNRAVQADDKLPSSRVAQGAAGLLQQGTQALNLDPRLAMVGMVAAGAGNSARQSRAGVRPLSQGQARTQRRQNPGGSPTHARADAPRKPDVRNGNWAVVQDEHGKLTGSYAHLSPEEKANLKPLQLPPGKDGTPRTAPGFVTANAPEAKPPDRYSGRRFDPETNSYVDRSYAEQPTRYGDPRYQPPTNRGPEPTPSPRPQRAHVVGPAGPKRLAQGYDVKPEDMSPRIGDGNNYGNFAGPNEVSGFSASGQFILENKNPHRQARDAQRQGFLDSHQAQKAAELNQDSIRQQVWWADGDLDKLNAILVELGGHPQKYASTAERAINKKLSALEHTYAGKTVLSLDERAALAQQWDWENLSGVTQHEVNRLNQLANGPYNSQFQRPITPQPSGAYKGAQVPPDIQERLDALQGEGGLRRRQQEQNPKAYTNRTPKPTERSERMTEKRDKEVTQQRTSRYQPKLSEEEKARRRAGRPLRPRDLRVNR